jgi:hypothetical protein
VASRSGSALRIVIDRKIVSAPMSAERASVNIWVLAQRAMRER